MGPILMHDVVSLIAFFMLIMSWMSMLIHDGHVQAIVRVRGLEIKIGVMECTHAAPRLGLGVKLDEVLGHRSLLTTINGQKKKRREKRVRCVFFSFFNFYPTYALNGTTD